LEHDDTASRAEISKRDFIQKLKDEGIANDHDDILIDGQIHHTSEGMYQAVLYESNCFANEAIEGQFQKWRFRQSNGLSDPIGWFQSDVGPLPQNDEIPYDDIAAKANPYNWEYEYRSRWAEERRVPKEYADRFFDKVQWEQYRLDNEKNGLLSGFSSDGKVKEYAKSAWVVKKLIPSGGLGWFYGAPNCHKTFLAMHMACCVATGRDWAGRSVSQGPVLYISAEGGDDIHARRKAWEIENGIQAKSLKIVSARPQFDDEDRARVFIQVHIREFQYIFGAPPALFILDTYSQTSSDDTKSAVNRYTKTMGDILKDFAPKSAFLVIDHTTKEGGTWMGSQAKMGNIDAMAMVSSNGEFVSLSMKGGKGRVRRAPDFDDIKFKPKLVGLGEQDADGEEISTLVLKDFSPKLNATDQAALDFIGEGVTRAEFRDWFKSLPENESAKPGTVRARVKRLLQKLADLSLIEPVEDDDESPVTPL